MKQRPPRLERDPAFNEKRRTGTGTINLETCPTCGFRIPDARDVEQGELVPCSAYHVRCVRCQWPVEQSHLSPDGLCVVCMAPSDRKRYYRRRGEVVTEEKQQQYHQSYGQVSPSVIATYVRARDRKKTTTEDAEHSTVVQQEEQI